ELIEDRDRENPEEAEGDPRFERVVRQIDRIVVDVEVTGRVEYVLLPIAGRRFKRVCVWRHRPLPIHHCATTRSPIGVIVYAKIERCGNCAATPPDSRLQGMTTPATGPRPHLIAWILSQSALL